MVALSSARAPALTPSTRRVRALRLAAPSEALARRGALLVADALHTASLPGADGGPLIVVRALHLGRILSTSSSATVALALEHAFSQMRARAVHAYDSSAQTATAVYFRDEVEAYAALACRLARGESAHEWFWRLAVPAWNPGMAASEGLRLLIATCARSHAGPAAAVALLVALHEQRLIDVLLALLQPADGEWLVRDFGWRKPSMPYRIAEGELAPPVIEPDRQWLAVLRRWLRVWGVDDERSLWLAGVALAATHPARLADVDLLDGARRIVGVLMRVSPAWQVNASTDSAIAQEPSLALNASPTRSVEPAVTRACDRIADASAPPIRRGRAAIVSAADTVARGRDVAPHQAFLEPWPDGAPSSAFAGLFFVLPVLHRLEFVAWVSTYEQYRGTNLPSRILRRIADRLGCAADDPVLLSLDDWSAVPAGVSEEILFPASWQSGLTRGNGARVARVGGNRRLRLLCDGSGRLPIALWRAPASSTLKALVGGRMLRRSSPVESVDAVLVHAWMTAVRRWCRRYAHIGLRSLVARRGRVLVTRTHIDVHFDLAQADMRVRRVGLDLNPGWLPWFGRVVQFHYGNDNER